MPRSSKLEPEVQALVDHAAWARAAIEALAGHPEERQSKSWAVICHKVGHKSRRFEHVAFCCGGLKYESVAISGWQPSADRAAAVLAEVVADSIEKGMPGPAGDRVLVWRALPEITSITSEIGDLFNAYARLTVVPAGWRIEFPEDDDAPMDASHGGAAPNRPPISV